jgi:hypothetical protein
MKPGMLDGVVVPTSSDPSGSVVIVEGKSRPEAKVVTRSPAGGDRSKDAPREVAGISARAAIPSKAFLREGRKAIESIQDLYHSSS